METVYVAPLRSTLVQGFPIRGIPPKGDFRVSGEIGTHIGRHKLLGYRCNPNLAEVIPGIV